MKLGGELSLNEMREKLSLNKVASDDTLNSLGLLAKHPAT